MFKKTIQYGKSKKYKTADIPEDNPLLAARTRKKYIY